MITYSALRLNLTQASRAEYIDEGVVMTVTDLYPTRYSDLNVIRFHDALRPTQYYTCESRDGLIHAADWSYAEPETRI